MSQETWASSINQELEAILQNKIQDAGVRERMQYSLIPPGKLFRPFLVHHLAHDLGEITPSHLTFSCSLEIHHCYTLIHDDLPSMDDDDMRRGKPSSHLKYSEWEAILTGDALLNLSYQLLSQVRVRSLPSLLELYGNYTGGNGLILGQVIDMKAESKELEEVLRIHKLKTAALMQLALQGSCMISGREDLLEACDDIGLKVGINFQLLDDLCELGEEVKGHELEANPFLHFNPEDIMKLVRDNHQTIHQLCEQNNFNSLQSYLKSFEQKVYQKLETHKDAILEKIKISESEWKFLAS